MNLSEGVGTCRRIATSLPAERLGRAGKPSGAGGCDCRNDIT